jgi:ribosomal protein S18 acetylase RimI-like enzyme
VSVAREHVLDNAGWHALTGPHAGFAEGDGRARRYRPDVSVFHAAADDSPEAWDSVAPLATRDGIVVLFRVGALTAPDGWNEVLAGDGYQMVLTEPLGDVPDLPATDPVTGHAVTMRPLGDGDVDAMVALVELTEPGPFRRRTIELGGYIGVFHGDALVAMAGQRLAPPGYREVSAVCTHPDARRRGYASIVSAAVARTILERGETPFLHVAVDNAPAIPVYEQLGFATRGVARFAAYRVPR